MNENSEKPKKASVVEVDNKASFSSILTIISSKESSLLQEQPSAPSVESGVVLTQSVIINGIHEFTNYQYMDEFEKHIDINNLLSFSIIFENRVCFTL